MKRLIAFALALAVVFGVSFALYKPERIEAAAQETMDDEWVGYFFALEPFDGRRYATENGDDYDFGVPGVPGALVEMTYTVEAQGALQVEAVYHAVPGAPELPCFGVKFETTAPVVRTCWTGLSGETYPDRYKGGVFGCHAETPHIEPALVPQDCGLHMDTQQVCLQLANGKTLTIEQTGEAFAFSALPNTAQQIEAAQHLCELPETGRTSITVLGAARGVGGIDSWCTDVEEPYRLSGECDRSVRFRIVL